MDLPDVRKYEYIDALRGYAVLLVIGSHVGGAFTQLPWPIHALANFGFYGVQLFFIVSCVTLMTSWNARRCREQVPLTCFFVRRLFRILPMYAAAAGLYIVIEPPGHKFSWTTFISSLTFTNGWSPGMLGTSDTGWTVVPGGWSITVEFTFYMLFPLLVALITSLRRAILAFLFSLPIAFVANRIAETRYLSEYGPRATAQFIYYWIPNQLSVFALGFVAFYLVSSLKRSSMLSLSDRHRSPFTMILPLIGLAVVLSRRSLPRAVDLNWPFLPGHVLAGGLFVAVLCVLSVATRTILINKMIVALGRVSFSAYLLHFAVISLAVFVFPSIFKVHSTGVEAIFRCGLLLIVVIPLTFLFSLATYRWIERPMIECGGRLCVRINEVGARWAGAIA